MKAGHVTANHVPENIGLARLTVRLSAASGKTARVNYATSAITAMPGQDYITTSGLLTFTPGQISKAIAVRILNDSATEPPETLRLTLTGLQNAAFGISVHTLTIDRPSFAPHWSLYR